MRLLCFFTLVLMSTSLWAGHRGDLRQNAQTASSIVLGEVTDTRSYYGTDGEIYTDVTVKVSAALKETARKSGALRSFTVKGGSVGDTRVMFTDVPAFEVDEAVVLFLENDQATEKYSLRGRWVSELNQPAEKVLEQIEESLRDQDTPLVEAERQRAHFFLSELAATAPAPDAACYLLIGPKWSDSLATYKIGTTIPGDWNTALEMAAGSWNKAGTVFNFKSDSASTNEFILGTVSGANVLASTRIEYNSANQMRRFTMTFNNLYTWSATGEAGKFDIENVTAHELGHALGLNHPSASVCGEQTMWASAAAGETKKRTLENGDKAGILVLYVAAGTVTPPPPPPPPATVTPAPVLTGTFFFPSSPAAGQNFTLWLTGSGFSTSTVQIVITGPACPTGCILNPGYRVPTLLSGTTSIATKGAYTVVVRNGAAGTPSAARPLTIR